MSDARAPIANLFAGTNASPFGRAQRRPRGARIPVSIVTGFLGAGKTTLIRALLDSPEGANTAIVVNEYGEIGIDNALLRASSDTTVLLGNGCVCCLMRSDLQESLRAMFADRARGAVPQPTLRVAHDLGQGRVHREPLGRWRGALYGRADQRMLKAHLGSMRLCKTPFGRATEGRKFHLSPGDERGC